MGEGGLEGGRALHLVGKHGQGPTVPGMHRCCDRGSTGKDGAPLQLPPSSFLKSCVGGVGKGGFWVKIPQQMAFFWAFSFHNVWAEFPGIFRPPLPKDVGI